MALPKIQFEEAEVHGVKIRGLSRSEAMKLAAFAEDPDAAEIYIISAVTGYSEEEVTQWRNETAAGPVGEIVEKILQLSGLTEGAQFQK